MEKTKPTIAIALLAVLLISSTIVLMGNSAVLSQYRAKPLSPEPDYGDILQYEWNCSGGQEGYTGFSAGPGPDRATVLWRTRVSGSGFLCAFDNKLFVINQRTLRAMNPFTGDTIYLVNLNSSANGNGNGGVNKIDDNNLLICTGVGIEVRRISDGAYVSNLTVPYYGGHPGSAQYFPGSYSQSMKMDFCLSYDTVQGKGFCNAISVANPANPVIAWTYPCTHVSEVQGSGGGMVYLGTTANTLIALNGTTGEFLWETPKNGVVQQHGMYYEGNFYQSASTQVMTCWNVTTGEVTWEYDASKLGERAYFAYRGAAAYGRIYDQAIPNDPHGWVVCWDAETGELLWKQPAYYNIAYSTVAVADGKVYSSTCDQGSGSVTAGLVMPGQEFSCMDAFTGEMLWKIRGFTFSTPTVAYGNLYGSAGGYIYCIGESTPAKPWSFGYIGNTEQQRIAVGQTGPEDLSTPRWVFTTGAKVASSPAVADGKVYVGSDDHFLYCLDAYTGDLVWKFETEYEQGSGPAVYNGKVYTGADDGNFYCLDANTGDLLWQRDAGGLFKYIMMPQELQSRSSPIIVNNKLYCGSLDNRFYCLNPSSGNVLWTYPTGGPIGGSPVYANGSIYFCSTDTYLYSLDAETGRLNWKSIPLNLDVGINPTYAYFCTGTPVVANGTVWVPGGVTYGIALSRMGPGGGGSPSGPGGISGGAYGGTLRLAAFNQTSGASIWNQTLAGNSGGVWQPTYFNGNLYFVENMRVSMMNAYNPNTGLIQPLGFSGQKAGNRTWSQWIGYQLLSSVTYADDVRGPKVYVGSDVGSITCLNATDGTAISAYQTGSNVEGSASLWEGKLYIGGCDRNVYCFDDSPLMNTRIWGEADKGQEMWTGETISIRGQLLANPMETTLVKDPVTNRSIYQKFASDMHPGMPNENVTISFTKPDFTSFNVTATTDNRGYFTISTVPEEVGEWGWVAFYDGFVKQSIIYEDSFTNYYTFNVIPAPVEPTIEPTPSPTPEVTPTPTEAPTTAPPTTAGTGGSTFGNIPSEFVYGAVAAVVIVVAIAAVLMMRRKKKEAA